MKEAVGLQQRALSRTNAEPAATGRNLGIDEEKRGKGGRRGGMVTKGLWEKKREGRIRKYGRPLFLVCTKEGENYARVLQGGIASLLSCS